MAEAPRGLGGIRDRAALCVCTDQINTLKNSTFSALMERETEKNIMSLYYVFFFKSRPPAQGERDTERERGGGVRGHFSCSGWYITSEDKSSFSPSAAEPAEIFLHLFRQP